MLIMIKIPDLLVHKINSRYGTLVTAGTQVSHSQGPASNCSFVLRCRSSMRPGTNGAPDSWLQYDPTLTEFRK